MRAAMLVYCLLLAAGTANGQSAGKSKKGTAKNRPGNREVTIPVDDKGSSVRMKGTYHRPNPKTGSKGRVSLAIGINGGKSRPVTEVSGVMVLRGAVVDRDESSKQGFGGDTRSGVNVSADGTRIEFHGKSTKLNWSNLSLRPTRPGEPTVTITLSTRKGKRADTYRITPKGLFPVQGKSE